MADGIEQWREEVDHPSLRCEAVRPNSGPCMNKKQEGSNFCKCCSTGRSSVKNIRNYRAAMIREELNKYTDSATIRSLREEIGILRLTLDQYLSRCTSTADLMYSCGPITDLISRIEKLVVSCHKLEIASGSLLDRQAVSQFADEVIKILTDHLDPETLDVVAEAILGSITQ